MKSAKAAWSRGKRTVTGSGALLIVGAAGLMLACPPRRFTAPWGPVVAEAADEDRDTRPPANQLGGPDRPIGQPVSWTPRPTPYFNLRANAGDRTALKRYLNGLVYDRSREHGAPGLLPCRPGQCPPSPGGVNAYIQPEIGAHLVNFDNIPRGEGYVAARILNYSQGTDSILRLQPETRHWWFVYKDTGGRLRSLIFYRTYSETGAQVDSVKPSKPFYACIGHEGFDRTRPAIAAWGDCESAKTQPTSGAAARAFLSPIRSLIAAPPSTRARQASSTAISGDSWITCPTYGCCIGANSTL